MGEQEEADLEHAVELIRRHGALDDTVERARHYGAMARDALGQGSSSECWNSKVTSDGRSSFVSRVTWAVTPDSSIRSSFEKGRPTSR